MLVSFDVKNFRCLRHLELRKLAPVNILVGDNDTGKTAVLEAIFLHLLQGNIGGVPKVKAFRRTPTALDETAWRDLFPDFDETKEIELSSVDHLQELRISRFTVGEVSEARTSTSTSGIQDSGERQQPRTYRPLLVKFATSSQQGPFQNELRIDFEKGEFVSKKHEPDIGGHYFSTAGIPDLRDTAQSLSKLIVNKTEGEVVAVARTVEERIRNLNVASPNRIPEVFVDFGEETLHPLNLLGSGVVRAVGIAATIHGLRGGVLLVDEIDNGIYFKRLGDLWKGLSALASKYDVQVFATTHSAECIKAAAENIPAGLYNAEPLRVYRLARGDQRTIPYDWESLQSVVELQAEIR